jgi:hypothetical protein
MKTAIYDTQIWHEVSKHFAVKEQIKVVVETAYPTWEIEACGPWIKSD